MITNGDELRQSHMVKHGWTTWKGDGVTKA